MELAVYGYWWVLFVVVVIVCARAWDFWGIVAGHFLVAVLVCASDIWWVQSEMEKPGWNGLPDMDMSFQAGMIARVIMVNLVLVPISVISLYSRYLGKWMRGEEM